MTIRSIVRSLTRRPAYFLAAVLTMAVGLAATTAVVAVAKAVLLRPLPYPKPEGLFRINASRPAADGVATAFVLSPIEFDRLKRQANALEQVEAFSPIEMALSVGGEPDTVKAGAVSAGFLQLFGLQPALGRGFTDQEDAGRLPVVILDGNAWASRFGRDPRVVGRTIRLDGAPYVVVGVSPEGYRPLLQSVDVWVPLGAKEDPAKAFGRTLLVTSRLATGWTSSQAREQIATIERQIARDYPDSHADTTLAFTDLRDALYGSYRPALVLLGAAVAALLLIACTNVGNLTLTRVSERRAEFAMRASLGASRSAIVRQQLAETAVICVCGALIGVPLAYGAVPAVLSIYPAALPADAVVRMDVRVAVLIIGVVAAAALVAGLVPALKAAAPRATSVLPESSSRTVGSHGVARSHQILVASQIALSLVLLATTALVATSIRRLNQRDPGFDAANVLTLQLAPPARYRDAQARASFLERVLARISDIPDVTAAGSTQTTFEANSTMTTRLVIESQAVDVGDAPQVNIRHVTPGYYDAMRIRMLEGRALDRRDRFGAPFAAVVSRAFARRYWPGTSALGHRVRRVQSVGTAPWLTVVGVADDVMDGGLGIEIGPTLYVPYLQQNTATARISLTIRTRSEPEAVANAVRQAIWSVDPQQPIDRVQPLEDALGASIAQPRFRAVLVTLFGVAGLFLACIGVYGMSAYTARQQTREIGVRMALGADGRHIRSFLLRRSLPPIAAGSIAGAAAAGAFLRLTVSLLYKPTLGDGRLVAAAAAGLVVCALVATLIPAARAARLSPSDAIQSQ
jgi:predicted permease